MLLVGDTLADNVLGYANTIPVTMPEMLHHARAVAEARRSSCSSVTCRSARTSGRAATRSERDRISEGRHARDQARGRRLGGGHGRAPHAAGHPRDGPSRADAAVGERLRGHEGAGSQRRRPRAAARRCARRCRTPAPSPSSSKGSHGISRPRCTAKLAIPTIGIGAGPDCDAQVLVIYDLLGITDHIRGVVPKFVKPYENLGDRIVAAARAYADDVREGRFPDDAHSLPLTASPGSTPRQTSAAGRRHATRPVRASAWSHDGRAACRPPCPDRPGGGGERPRGGHDLREPRAVRPTRGLQPIPPKPRRGPRRRGRRRVARASSCRASMRCTRRARSPGCTSPGLGERSRGRAAPVTSTAWPSSFPSCSWPACPTGRTSARRTRSSAPWCAASSATWTLGVDIVVCPTVRDTDGLAISSRNVYLSQEDRVRARAIPGQPQSMRCADSTRANMKLRL